MKTYRLACLLLLSLLLCSVVATPAAAQDTNPTPFIFGQQPPVQQPPVQFPTQPPLAFPTLAPPTSAPVQPIQSTPRPTFTSVPFLFGGSPTPTLQAIDTLVLPAREAGEETTPTRTPSAQPSASATPAAILESTISPALEPTLQPTEPLTGNDTDLEPLATLIVTPQRVEVQADDGLTLVGDLWNAELSTQTPAVLLLHMNNSNRRSWDPLIPALVQAGYRVIAPDLRGFGETGGTINWDMAVGDVQTWIDWMRLQPSIQPDAIATIGASVSANLALVGCASDLECVTAVGISPGLNFFGIQPETYVADGLAGRSALLVAAQNDIASSDAVRQMVYTATGDVGVQIFSGRSHGTELFDTDGEQLIALIVNWLETHMPPQDAS